LETDKILEVLGFIKWMNLSFILHAVGSLANNVIHQIVVACAAGFVAISRPGYLVKEGFQ